MINTANTPLHCEEVAESLWVLHIGDKVSNWSSSYGVLLRVVSLTGLPGGIIHSSPADITNHSWFLPNGRNRTANGISTALYIASFLDIKSSRFD